MDNISFKPLMLRHNKVISSAYDKAPIYVLFKKQPTPDSFKLINNLSIYSVKRTGDKTPPCFTPLDKEKYLDLNTPQPTQDFLSYITIQQ